jgi:hypothetical protein
VAKQKLKTCNKKLLEERKREGGVERDVERKKERKKVRKKERKKEGKKEKWLLI